MSLYSVGRAWLLPWLLLGCTQTAVIPDDADAAPSDAAAEGGPAMGIALPLQTQGRYVVDARGARVKLAGVNWYGAESATLIPDGLALQERHDVAKLIRSLGFNSVRVPWCNQLVAENPVVDGARLTRNPDLIGKTALEVLDAVIDALIGEGLLVILDNHRGRGDWCCDTVHGDGLWYTEQYPESDFIAHWQTMTARYASRPAVIGMDLRNELRSQLVAGAPASCGGDCVDLPRTEMPRKSPGAA